MSPVEVSAFVIQETSPRLIKFREYARVELRPPTQADLKPAVEQATKLICAFKSGAWKNVSVKVYIDALLFIFRKGLLML